MCSIWPALVLWKSETLDDNCAHIFQNIVDEMVLTVDLLNLTDFSFTNISDGSGLTPTSRFSSNDKRAVTHIFVSQNALAALVQSCQKSDIVTWSILLNLALSRSDFHFFNLVNFEKKIAINKDKMEWNVFLLFCFSQLCPPCSTWSSLHPCLPGCQKKPAFL